MPSIWEDPADMRFFVRFPKSWRRLTGMGFGLREPALVGHVHARLPVAIDFTELDRRMARHIPENPPDEEAGVSPTLHLVRRAMFWTGALQRLAQLPVFGRAYVGTPERSEQGEVLRLALPYYAPPAAVAALQWIDSAINSFILTGRLSSLPAEEAERQFAELNNTLRKHRPKGLNTYRLLGAAHDLEIPVRQVVPSIFVFGIGARSRWLQSTITDRTSFLASRIGGDKFLTAQLLRAAGLPGATHELARSPEEAVKAANRIGNPVIVKPADRQQGLGVAADLTSDQAVAAAFAEAAKCSKRILVEKHFEGSELRITVFDGKTFRVAARRAGGVTGDGNHTASRPPRAAPSICVLAAKCPPAAPSPCGRIQRKATPISSRYGSRK
jgi:cyanophycin synthetase